MNRSGAAVIAGFILAAVIIVGVLYLGREILQLYGDLDARFLAFAILAIVISLIIAAGLRRSGETSERLYRIQKKADAYNAYLQTVGSCEEAIASDTARDLGLWSAPRVLRVIESRPAEGSPDTAKREWLIWLLREMRQDLGQSNMQLKLDGIVDDILSGTNAGVDECKLS